MIFTAAARFCADNGLPYGGQLDAKLALYADFLADYNQKVNLTAITERSAVEIRHFCDSLAAAAAIKPAGRLLDVGSGAGFPGVVLKLLCPELELALLDSNGKKAEFLRLLCEKLEIKAQIIYDRAEVAAQRKEYREQFDIVTARAVAAQNLLCEYCLPFVRVGGVFLSLKSGEYAAELAAADSSAKLLGGGEPDVKTLELPDTSRRAIISTPKLRPTPTAYPRAGAKIAKKPL